MKVYDIDQYQHESYVHACEEMGYIVDSKNKYNKTYEAYNKNGNYTQLMYFSSNTDLTIQVEAPEPMVKLIGIKVILQSVYQFLNHLTAIYTGRLIMVL